MRYFFQKYRGLRHIKKTQQHPKANEEARIAFKEKIAAYENEGKTIIYIDESGFAHDMPRVARMLSVPLSILLFLRWECLSLLSTRMCFMRG